ncbi:hypothetical protein D9M69_462570 [compost metagenome]
MPKFHWTGAAGDDSREKRNWRPDLPPPPREVYALCDRAERVGLWLKWARDPVALSRFGARYRLVRPGTDEVVHAADELAGIREHLDSLEVGA